MKTDRQIAIALSKKARHCGIFVEEPCVHCGSTGRTHAHHPDYSKPLAIVWLCPKCHSQEHARLKPKTRRERPTLSNKNELRPTVPVGANWTFAIPRIARILLSWDSPTFSLQPIIDRENDTIMFKRVRRNAPKPAGVEKC